jgi:hypothetical protein
MKVKGANREIGVPGKPKAGDSSADNGGWKSVNVPKVKDPTRRGGPWGTQRRRKKHKSKINAETQRAARTA